MKETTKQRVSRLMRANKSGNTKPELALRKALWAEKLFGYRVHSKKLPGKPDVSYTKKRLAVFVHGCYWHQCPKCDKSYPKKNKEFWDKKFSENKERDERNFSKLKEQGWKVLLLWECDIKSDLTGCVNLVKENLVAS